MRAALALVASASACKYEYRALDRADAAVVAALYARPCARCVLAPAGRNCTAACADAAPPQRSHACSVFGDQKHPPLAARAAMTSRAGCAEVLYRADAVGFVAALPCRLDAAAGRRARPLSRRRR